MSARVAAADHAFGLCQRIHMAGEPVAADCVACAVQRAKLSGKSYKHILCSRCKEKVEDEHS